MDTTGTTRARERIEAAAAEEKCRPCGCFHQALDGAETVPDEALAGAIAAAREAALPVAYDCMGCTPCGPSEALGALIDAGHRIPLDNVCRRESAVRPRTGWPPLPGHFRVLRYRAPVAVCTLLDESLMDEVALRGGPAVAIVGTLSTENLGIERIVKNVAANPEIRRLVVCGPDSRRRVGHRPGASLVAFAENGVNEDGTIVGAPGKRPVIRNVIGVVLERFRASVEVVDLVDESGLEKILEAVNAPLRGAAATTPPPDVRVERVSGRLPATTTPDPAGWFVIHLDRSRDRIVLEHYERDGTLGLVVEAATPAECWFPAIERGLLTRLDHAAYLGRELERAARALLTGGKYIQDSAPELPSE